MIHNDLERKDFKLQMAELIMEWMECYASRIREIVLDAGLQDEVTAIYPAQWLGPKTSSYPEEMFISVHAENKFIHKVKSILEICYPKSEFYIFGNKIRILYHLPFSFRTCLDSIQDTVRTIPYLPGAVKSLTRHLTQDRCHNNIIMIHSMNCRYKEGKLKAIGTDHLVIFTLFKGLKPLLDDIFPTEWKHDDVTYPVDIIDGGYYFEFGHASVSRRFRPACKRQDPVLMGHSIGLSNCSGLQNCNVGSVGCFVSGQNQDPKRNEKIWALTVGHITASESELSALKRDGSLSIVKSDPIVEENPMILTQPSPMDHPDPKDVGRRTDVLIGNISGTREGCEVGIDAALVELSADYEASFIPFIDPRQNFPKHVYELYQKRTIEKEPRLCNEDRFINVGRTSGMMVGTMFASDATVFLKIDQRQYRSPFVKTVPFVNQFVFAGDKDPFSCAGDSGSVVWRLDNDDEQLFPVALSWCSTWTLTAASPLDAILGHFNVKMILK